MIDVSQENYMAYLKEFYGVSIFVHRPGDFVTKTLTPAISLPGFETVSLVTANVVVSDPLIRSMPLSQRGCYFDGEVG